MPDSTIEEYQKLSEIMDSSNAAIFSKSLRGFHAHYYIYARNYEDLISCLKNVEKIGPHLTAVEPGEDSNIRKTYKEVARLIFNFLSSAKARIDYTRCFMDENYENTDLIASYKKYITVNYSEDELSRFINDLRNYILHKGIPHIAISVNWSASKAHVYIEKEQIMNSSFWSPPSKAFLSKCESEIQLRPLFVEYGKKIYVQADWIIHKLYQHHNSDIDEFKRMQSDLNGILAKLNRVGNAEQE